MVKPTRVTNSIRALRFAKRRGLAPLEEIKVCVAYRCQGETLREMPAACRDASLAILIWTSRLSSVSDSTFGSRPGGRARARIASAGSSTSLSCCFFTYCRAGPSWTSTYSALAIGDACLKKICSWAASVAVAPETRPTARAVTPRPDSGTRSAAPTAAMSASAAARSAVPTTEGALEGGGGLVVPDQRVQRELLLPRRRLQVRVGGEAERVDQLADHLAVGDEREVGLDGAAQHPGTGRAELADLVQGVLEHRVQVPGQLGPHRGGRVVHLRRPDDQAVPAGLRAEEAQRQQPLLLHLLDQGAELYRVVHHVGGPASLRDRVHPAEHERKAGQHHCHQRQQDQQRQLLPDPEPTE